MKVLLIDPQSDDNLGLYDYHLMTNLEGNIIFCGSVTYNGPKIVSKNIRTELVFSYLLEKKTLKKAFSYVRSIFKVARLIKKERPDIVHIQWWKIWPLDYCFLNVIKPYCGKIVFTAHNLVPHNSGDKYKDRCIKYYKRVDKIIVHVSKSKVELVSDFGIEESKIFVIPHGLLDFTSKTTVKDGKYEKLAETNHFNEKIVFSAMGIQSNYKGTDIIVDAILNNDAIRNNSKFFFIIAGKGNIATKNLFKDCNNVYVNNNYLSNDEFEKLLQLSDVLLLPYRRISQSGVLLTAISNKIPYIATDVGGLSNPLIVAKVGWIINEASSKALADIILELANMNCHQIKSIKYNDAEWNRVKVLYDWGNIGKKTMVCYSS